MNRPPYQHRENRSIDLSFQAPKAVTMSKIPHKDPKQAIFCNPWLYAFYCLCFLFLPSYFSKKENHDSPKCHLDWYEGTRGRRQEQIRRRRSAESSMFGRLVRKFPPHKTAKNKVQYHPSRKLTNVPWIGTICFRERLVFKSHHFSVGWWTKPLFGKWGWNSPFPSIKKWLNMGVQEVPDSFSETLGRTWTRPAGALHLRSLLHAEGHAAHLLHHLCCCMTGWIRVHALQLFGTPPKKKTNMTMEKQPCVQM